MVPQPLRSTPSRFISVSLIGGGNEKLVAGIMITLFYFINFFGVDFMAKAQNLMTAILLLARHLVHRPWPSQGSTGDHFGGRRPG